MGLGVDDLAWRAVDVAQGLMGHALQAIVTRRGYDLRGCTLVAYGGGGPVHAGPLAARIGIARVLVPALAPVLFSALGCCLAEVGVEAVRGPGARSTTTGWPASSRSPRPGHRGEAACSAPIPHCCASPRRLELRYRGQNGELPVSGRRGRTPPR